MNGAGWTTSDDIARQALRLWDGGQLLAAGLTGEPRFPLPLRLRRPGPRELGERFEAVRAWIGALEAGAKTSRGFGYEIAWEEINSRQLGRNRVPAGLVLPTRNDALALIDKQRDAERFNALARPTIAAFPELERCVARKPLALLAHGDDWPRILDVAAWFREHPRSGLYQRQIDIPSIDTKFIEAHKAILAELLDIVLPADAIDAAASGLKAFETRYGLRTKPALIRFRILDANMAIAGLTDLTVPAAQFATLAPSPRHVFITENEVNGLAFPALADSLVIFGLGYALGLLASVSWLQSREIHYWGDIDTHGFAMLDALRAHLPHAHSLLMDRKTLDAHWPHHSREPAPCIGDLERLTPTEKALYDELRHDRLGDRVRLEQERIAFGWLEQALAEL